MTLWKPQYTVKDLYELSNNLYPFLYGLSPVQWQIKTGKRDNDWTIQQTLAHLVSISQFFRQGVTCALQDKPLNIPNLSQRDDLRAFNTRELERLASVSPADLITRLQQSLDTVQQTLHALTPEQYTRTIDIRIYNRPLQVIDLLDFQLTHIGIIHGAQIVRVDDDVSPLWTQFPAEMTGRMVSRFLRHLGYAYWSSHAGDLSGVIDFHIGGNHWYVTVTPEGSQLTPSPDDLSLLFEATITDADVFFSLFTMHMTLPDALKTGALRLTGDYPEPLTLLSYFSASPPRRDLPAYP